MDLKLADFVLKQKRVVLKSENCLIWAFVNFVFASLVLYDITCCNYSLCYIWLFTCVSFGSNFLQYLELALAVLLSWNTLFDLAIYLWPTMGMKSIVLEPIQKTLFGIKDWDRGFQVTPHKEPPHTGQEGSRMSPEGFGSFLQSSYLFHSTPTGISSPYNNTASTPLDISATSWVSSFSLDSNLSSASTSWNFYQDNHKGSASFENNNSQMRHRPQMGSSSSSFSALKDLEITDEKSLEKYMDEYKRMELKQLSCKKEDQSSMGYGSSSPMNSASHPLWRFHYQTASLSTQSSSILSGDSDFNTKFSGDSLFARLRISEEALTAATQNLRKWIRETILVPLVTEIDSVNELLARLGSSDLQIGDVSLTTLRQISSTKGQLLPTLPALIPYLDFHPNQDYLVKRLKELSLKGCMSDFRWNSGGKHNGKPWTDELPSDCGIVIHAFNTYMDSRLPPHPNYPDGKTFSTRHFKKSQTSCKNMDTLYIYQEKVNPPHFKLAIGEELWDVPKGRNNLFYTILIFLHHIRRHQCGMLGRINLGSSGINILWIIDGLEE